MPVNKWSRSDDCVCDSEGRAGEGKALLAEVSGKGLDGRRWTQCESLLWGCEYWAEDADGDGVAEMYKGEQRINGEYTMVDDLADMLDIDISVFYNDVRLITTLKDTDGNRATGTSASVIVKKEQA